MPRKAKPDLNKTFLETSEADDLVRAIQEITNINDRVGSDLEFEGKKTHERE